MDQFKGLSRETPASLYLHAYTYALNDPRTMETLPHTYVTTEPAGFFSLDFFFFSAQHSGRMGFCSTWTIHVTGQFPKDF